MCVCEWVCLHACVRAHWTKRAEAVTSVTFTLSSACSPQTSSGLFADFGNQFRKPVCPWLVRRFVEITQCLAAAVLRADRPSKQLERGGALRLFQLAGAGVLIWPRHWFPNLQTTVQHLDSRSGSIVLTLFLSLLLFSAIKKKNFLFLYSQKGLLLFKPSVFGLIFSHCLASFV